MGVLHSWPKANLSCKKQSPLKRSGFTLIELLVAITILAIVAVLGWRGLDSIVRARVALNDELARTRGLQLAFAQMQRDCSQIVPPTNLPDQPPLIVESGRIQMVRNVFADNQPPRLQVVAYRLKNGMLIRRETDGTRDLTVLKTLWKSVSEDSDSSQDVVLQAGVAGMDIRAWVNDGQGWRRDVAATTQRAMIRAEDGSWRPATATDGMAVANTMGPSGLEVVIRLEGKEVPFTKVFLLGAA